MIMEKKLLKRAPLNQLMDLKVDYAFKQLFGTEKNKEITVVFLNAILQRSGYERIKNVSFLNTDVSGEHQEDKQSRLDILAVTNADERINIEMQFTNKYDMIKRSIYYWAGVYREQMQRKMSYKELNPVIAINIMNFNLFDQTELFHTTYHLYEDKELFQLTDFMEFHFLEMPKLIKLWKQEKLDPWNDLLTRWLLLLGIVDHRNGKVYEDIYKELEEIAMKDEKLKNAFQSWEKLSATKEEMIAYEARLKKVLDDEAFIREAELREQEAIKKGLEKGLEQGIEQGIEQGVEKGRMVERKATILKMLKKGMGTEEIAGILECSEIEVKDVLEQYED